MKRLLKLKSKKSLFSSLFVFISIYFVVVTCFWVYWNFQSYSRREFVMDKYVQKHEDILKQKVFSDIFSKARTCAGQEDCEKLVSREISEVIIEEELTGESSYDWPNDLFFVKQEGNNFYSLNWEGKITDTSSQTHKTLISSKTPYMFKFLTRNCRFFGVGKLSSCEIYKSIALSSNQTGYIARLIPLTEENSFLFSLLFMPLTFLFTGQILFIIPLAGALLATFLFNKWEKKSRF